MVNQVFGGATGLETWENPQGFLYPQQQQTKSGVSYCLHPESTQCLKRTESDDSNSGVV